jgi:hypothetical protein
MKKTLLVNATLVVALSAMFVTLKSDNNGKVNLSTTGCKNCHGTTGKATTVVGITGLPAGGYVPGQMYTLAFTVTHPTYSKAGYNLSSTKGTLGVVGAGTGSKISSAQLTHSAVMNAIAGTCVFPFTWTAPIAGSGTVTFNGVGNAVNGDNIDNVADEWNLGTWDLVEAPAAIKNTESAMLVASPIPCTNVCNISGVHTATDVIVTDISGKRMYAPSTLVGSTLQINTEHLQSAAMYFVRATINGLAQSIKITK